MASWPAPPVIVAEALVGVPDPLLTSLRLPPASSPLSVAASLARSLAPAEADVTPPGWLLPEQLASLRRAIAALRRYRGAVLADPVGSGKTYIALAVASICNPGRPTACLVPATLRRQWEHTAATLGVDVMVGSHEQASRGRLPACTRGLVIVDESHHFRSPHTRRYGHVARWLVGRSALLVTATPIVNRLDDLIHQLRLAVRDDALVLEGIPSLRSLLANQCVTPALGRLVLESEVTSPARPQKAAVVSPPEPAECEAARKWVTGLSGLRLSNQPAIAALVRGTLLRAATSSPAALAGTLRRYRRLLENARDALQSGRSFERSELRRFTGELGDQLVWWELIPAGETANELDISDLPEIEKQMTEAYCAEGTPDTKLRRLGELLADGKPTVVFTCSRDTVRYIRDRLGEGRLAWCTGDRAGIGTTSLAREDVLWWFRSERFQPQGPRHLIVTDVAAEGLDLQRARRVIHYDLPWTPMRLEQREGRAVRLGSSHQTVEVVRFLSSPALERLLGVEAALSRKSKLPGRAGLGVEGRRIWRWRAELAARFRSADYTAGAAAIRSDTPGLLAGFALYPEREPSICLSAWVGWLEPEGSWSESPEIITERLLAVGGSPVADLQPGRLQASLELMMPPIRERLGAMQGRYWVPGAPTPGARQLTHQLHALIADAARKRDITRLRRLESALQFVSGGHTAGEAMLIERLASGGRLEQALGRWMGGGRRWDQIEVRLTGLLLFGG